MKKPVYALVLALCCILGTGCFTYTYDVGQGAQTGVTVTEKNHYVLYGLAPISTSDPSEMANGSDDYTVKIEHTFIDGLLNGITFGIYTPTTTTVTR